MTHYILDTLDPKWERGVEIFVSDYTQVIPAAVKLYYTIFALTWDLLKISLRLVDILLPRIPKMIQT